MNGAERPRYVAAPQKPELPPLPDCFLLEATRFQRESVLHLEIELREVIHEGGVEVPVMLLLFNPVHEVDEVPEVIATVVAQDIPESTVGLSVRVSG